MVRCRRSKDWFFYNFNGRHHMKASSKRNDFHKRNAHSSPLPLTTASEENCPPENCPLTIIGPTQANSPKRVLRVKWVKICIVYEYYDIRVLQLRSKNRFTSIYFLQILTKPCRAPLIREQLSLNASWFSSAIKQKNTIFWKNWFGKKFKKTS